MEVLIWLVAVWAMVLLTGWFGFVAYVRYRALKNREKGAGKVVLGTGASVTEEGEADSDTREAFNEQVAQLRGRFEKKYQSQ